MSKQQIVVHNNNNNNNRKSEEISNGLKQRIEAANAAANTAEKKIRIAYDYAIEVDGYRPKEAAKILYDRLVYSPQWIRKFIPLEAKNTEKIRPDQSHRKLTQNYAAETDSIASKAGTKTKKDKFVILPKKDEKRVVIMVPVEKVKKFYNELARIKDRAEKEGLRIFSDGTVQVLHF